MSMPNKISPLQNWLPIKFSNRDHLLVEWMNAGNKQFTEPFFDDSISAIKRIDRKHFRSVSSLEMVNEWSSLLTSLQPSAIIFHVSRCGSTLLSQLLANDERNIVLSEVPFLDEILRLPYKNENYSPGECLNYVQSAIKFYGQQRLASQEQLFIKTDSWHLHFYETLRKAYPNIPFILLYRNPAEVFQSQQKQRGLHAIPGMVEEKIFGISAVNTTDFDRHLAEVLSSYFRKMIAIKTSGDPLVISYNYRHGITGLVNKSYELIRMDMSQELQKKIAARTSYHAKNPQQIFAADYDGKNTPPYLQEAIELYKQLDRL